MTNYKMLERVEEYMNLVRKTAYRKINSLRLPPCEESEVVEEICQEVRVLALQNSTANVEKVGAKYVELMAKTATRRWAMGAGKRNRLEEDIYFTSFDDPDFLEISTAKSLDSYSFEESDIEELWEQYGKPAGFSLTEFSNFIYDDNAPGNSKYDFIREAIKQNTNIHTLKEGEMQ